MGSGIFFKVEGCLAISGEQEKREEDTKQERGAPRSEKKERLGFGKRGGKVGQVEASL